MPNSVDTRIVEMQFDNAKFEKNINQSIKSLEQLDKSLQLKDATKGFEQMEKAANSVDFSKMEKSLSFIEYRLTALGMTSAKVIDSMTTKVANFFKTLENNTIGQIKSGGMARALKLEHADFMLNGILKDADKVKEIMDKAVSPAVDGTAYGLDAAANAASQFVASGITDVKKLETALTGISGVAAMSGSEYEEIARIFTKIAASGRMMGDEVLQLSTRGINATAVLAEQLGVTADKVQEMQKKGQISFEMFSDAMNKAYGEQAKKANDTFTGALANMKAALSRIGADFATPYLNNMREIFNALRLTINDIRKELQPVVSMYIAAFSRLKNFTVELLKNEKFITIYKNSIKNVVQIIKILAEVLSPIGKGFRKAFPQGMLDMIASLTQRIWDSLHVLEINRSTLNDISDIIGGMFSALKIVFDILGKIKTALDPVLHILNVGLGVLIQILGVIGKLITQLSRSSSAGQKFKMVLNAIKTILLIIIGVLLQVVSAVGDVINAFWELPIVQEIFNDISNSVYGLAQKALPILAGAAGGVMTAFGGVISLFKSGKINEFFTKLNTKVEDFYHAAKAGKGVMSAFTNIFKGDFSLLPTRITAFAKSVDYANETISDTVKPGGLLPGLHMLHEATTNIGETINNIGNIIIENAKKFGIGRGLITGLSVSLIALFGSAAKLASTFQRAFAGVPSLISAMKQSLQAPLFEAKAKALILGLAVAIGSLTLALVGLTMVDSTKLVTATKCLGALIVVMTAAGIAVNKLGGGFDSFKNIAFSFISFAGAVTVLAIALQTLASIKVDMTELWIKVAMLGSIMLALGGVVILITRFAKPFSAVMGSGFMLAFALSIKMLVTSLKTIADLPLEDINAALPALLKMMRTLALIGAACTFLSPFAGLGFMGIVAGILLFLVGINAIAEHLKPDKFFYISETLKKMYDYTKTFLILVGIAAIVFAAARLAIAVASSIKLLSKGLSQISGWAVTMAEPAKIAAQALKTFASAAVIGTIAASFIAIAVTLEKMGKVPLPVLQQGALVMVAIASAFSMVIILLMAMQKLILGKLKFMNGLGQAFGSLAALMISLALSMKIIGSIPVEDLDRAVMIVVGILTILTIFMGISNLMAKNSKSFAMAIKTALALSTLILAISLAVGLLSMTVQGGDWTPLIAASAAVLIICVGLAAVCAALSQVEFLPAIAAAVGISAMFIALAVSLNLISELDLMDTVWKTALIVVAVGVMVGIVALLGKIKVDAAIGTAILLGITAIFAGLAIIAIIVSNIDTEGFKANLILLGFAVAALMIVVTLLGIAVVEAALGTVVLAVLTGIFWGLAEIANIIASIDSTAFLENLKTLGIAVGALAAVVAILGGLLMSPVGGVVGGALIAGCAALLALSVVMGVVAGVGWLFAQSLNQVSAALIMFGPALIIAADAVDHLSDLDFTGLLGNLASVVGTIEALALTAADSEMAGRALKELADSVLSLHDYAALLAADLPSIEQSVAIIKVNGETLVTSLSDISKVMNDAVKALASEELYNAITNLSRAMKEASTVEMNSVGIKMVEDLCAGFKSVIATEAPPIMTDFIDGLKNGAFNAEGDLTSLGAEMAQYLIAGFRGPDGINAHSPALEAWNAVKDFVAGLFKGSEDTKPEQEQIGANMATAVTDKTKDTLSEQTPGVMQSLTDMMSTAESGAQNFLDNNPLIVNVKAKVDPLLNQFGINVGGAVQETKYKYKQKDDSYITHKEYNDARTLGRQKTKQYFEEREAAKKLEEATKAETSSLGGNTGGTKKNTKAKEENKKANDKKTKAIDEETEALEEETTEVEDNEEAIREQAEAIEIVTERFKDYLNTYKYNDSFKNATRLNKAFSKLWSADDKTLKDVNNTYNKVSESMTKSLKKINKQVLEFDNTGKFVSKFTKNLNTNLDSIQKRAVKVGRSILKFKVLGSATKVFYKVGQAVETMTITTTKNLKKLGKHFLAAKNFLATFNAEIEHQESSEEFIKTLRGIETYFGATKLGKMAEKTKTYLKGIANEFTELSNSMNILGKNIDGVGNILSKNSKSTAFVEDAFLSLAATLYDGTDAANEYATEHAKLLFLMENGLATQEEVDEHFQSYISRLKDTLIEYRNTIYENLAGSMDIWSEFNQNLMDEGTDLIHNIESQIAGYMNWSNMLMELSKRGFDSGILKMLTDEGVASFGKAKALMEMTSNELALFTVRYQQSQAVIEHATDTALAAVANAQTRASLRAAAAQGDKTAQKQLQQSKKNKKDLLDDARAVADYQAKYRKLNDKEEKKYLKSLTKEERKAYKDQLKAAKKQQKELEKAAKAEEAKRAEEDRIATIRTSIKTFEDYIHTINKYSKDSSVIAAITEDITKAFEPLNDTIAEFTDMTREDAINALLGFAETLDSTGNTANDYFTEMTERLTNYISTLKDAIKNQISFTEAIKTSSNGYTGNDFVRNLTTNLTAASQVATSVAQLREKFGGELVNNILSDIGTRLSSGANIGDILEILNTYLGMTQNQIMAINYGLLVTEKEAKDVANSLVSNITKATMDSNAVSRYEKATDALQTYSNKLRETRDELERTQNEYNSSSEQLRDVEAKMANASVAITKLEKKKKEGTITKKEKDKLNEYKAILKRYQEEAASLRATVEQNQTAMTNAQNAFNDASSSYNAALKEYAEAEKAYNKAVETYNKEKLNEEAIKARQEAELRLEQQAYQILNTISCYNDLINVEKTQTKQSRIMQKVTAGMKDVVKAVAGSIDEYGRRWKNVSNLSQMVNKDTEDITRAFLRLSDTLSSSGELSSDYFTNAAAKLSEYRDTLYDTIKGQVSLFESFDRYSGDKATSASTYLDNMNSQLTGLEEWLTGLETLSQRGVSGDLLQIFAAEGQNSYEKVMAFANATDEQLGELVSKYREYQKLTEEAADRALAAVGASYTDAAMSATEALIKAFQTNGATRLEETAYNAGAMIITGVKNGLGNSMPEIISATEDTAEAVSTTVSTKIGESVGKSINEGVVQAVANSVESTVNAAIEKFKMAVDTVNSYVQETLQNEFTITVHVNTSEIDAAVARMNQAVYGINTQAVETQDAYVSARQASVPTVDITPTEPAPTQDVNVTYVQNNYSPKSLSRTEIYRQTRNQLSTIEGVVSAATGG